MTPRANRPHAAPAPRILVADDEEGLLFLITDLLRREGFAVEGVQTAEEALDWLAGHSVDLLLLDLKLPDLSAQALVEKMRARGRDVPFIVVTGHGDERTAAEVMRQGALDYVLKESGMLELLPGIVWRALGAIERDRKLAEAGAAARRREERHQKIIQTAMDGFVRFDSAWRISEVNGTLCELLSYTAEQLRGLHLTDIVASGSHQQIEHCRAHLEERASAKCFAKLRPAHGAPIEVEISMRADASEYFGFIHDLTEQRRLEREVLQITEEERRRFGQELHDGLGQQLTAIELMSHTLARELKGALPALANSANRIAEITRAAVAQARRLAHGLAPVALEADGLKSALSDLARVTAATGVACEFEYEGPVHLHDVTAATHLYRMAQEAVNNALRHSKGSRIKLRLAALDGQIELTVEDNGTGLRSRRQAGLGLQVMQHRSRLIGANVQIDSRRGKGVRIVCSLPLSS